MGRGGDHADLMMEMVSARGIRRERCAPGVHLLAGSEKRANGGFGTNAKTSEDRTASPGT